jgi:lipid-A-disaccharide synthase
MKIYCIAGEASGDMHGAALLKEIRSRYPESIVRGWGGDLMQAEGLNLVRHYRETAFMGFVEVLRNLRTILRLLKEAQNDIQSFAPDLLVLIDYPGFNLRMAKFAKGLGIKVVYYISPQLWAWKERRIQTVRDCVDQMLCILPFEQDWYAKRGVSVHYVGHPLADNCKPYPIALKLNYRQALAKNEAVIAAFSWVALLPGSRLQEIRKHLPILLETVSSMQGVVAVVAMAPGVDSSEYQAILKTRVISDGKDSGRVLLTHRTRDLLACSDAALVASGTATLEAALLDCPMVAVYKVNPLSFLLGKALVKVPYVSLVNLILGREVIPERLQGQMTAPVLRADLIKLLPSADGEPGPGARSQRESYAALRAILAPATGNRDAASTFTASSRAVSCMEQAGLLAEFGLP